MRGAAKLAVAAFALALGGCDLMPDWVGEAEDPPLPGERISILALEIAPEADPRISDLRVRLPRPVNVTEWPQSGGGASHAMPHIMVSGNLNKAWVADIGEGASRRDRLLATPIVAGGRVFSFDTTSRVTAFDAASGQRLWRTLILSNDDVDDAYGGGLAIAGNRLFATNGAGEVLAIDPATGRGLWRVSLGAPIRAAPTVSGDRLFVATYDNQLFALDVADGETLWTHTGIVEPAQILGAPSPAVAGNVVVVAYSSGELVALRVDNGRVTWSDTLMFSGQRGPLSELGDINGSPVIDGDRVYAVSHAGRLVAISLRSGERIWDQDVAGVQTPWAAGDFLYIMTTDGNLLCLSRRDGRIRWVKSLPRYEDPEDRTGPILWSGPILVSDRLLIAGSNGEAVAVSPYTGDFLGRMNLREGIDLPPIAANGTVFFLTNDGDLIALR